ALPFGPSAFVTLVEGSTVLQSFTAAIAFADESTFHILLPRQQTAPGIDKLARPVLLALHRRPESQTRLLLPPTTRPRHPWKPIRVPGGPPDRYALRMTRLVHRGHP